MVKKKKYMLLLMISLQRQLTISRKVHLYEHGSAQGVKLLKGLKGVL